MSWPIRIAVLAGLWWLLRKEAEAAPRTTTPTPTTGPSKDDWLKSLFLRAYAPDHVVTREQGGDGPVFEAAVEAATAAGLPAGWIFWVARKLSTKIRDDHDELARRLKVAADAVLVWFGRLEPPRTVTGEDLSAWREKALAAGLRAAQNARQA